jgi:hypothetical protein
MKLKRKAQSTLALPKRTAFCIVLFWSHRLGNLNKHHIISYHTSYHVSYHIYHIISVLPDTMFCSDGFMPFFCVLAMVLLEKPIFLLASQEIPYRYGTRRFITVCTRSHHRSLSWARLIQFTPSHPISLDLSLYYAPICARYSGFPTKMLCVLHAPPISPSLIWSS